MSNHDSQHNTMISDESPAKRSDSLLIVGLILALLLPVLGGFLLIPSSTATENEDAARAAIRIKNLTDLQAADAAESSF